MSDSVYVVSTYYHALIACIKQLSCDARSDIVVTSYIPDSERLAERIRSAGLFRKVYAVGDVREYRPANRLDYFLRLHRKNAEAICKQIPFKFESYKNIYIFHDNIWAAHYCKDVLLDYHLIEDALDSFKIITTTRFAYMLPSGGIRDRIKRFFRLGYVYCGFDRCTLSVEVNDKQGLELKKIYGELKECPRKPMFDSLTSEHKRILTDIFASDIAAVDEDSVLVLTQALQEYGAVSCAAEQTEIYRRLIREVSQEGDVIYIKPHPRDDTDYAAAFPWAVVLDKNMPVEMFDIMGIRFRRAAALSFSTVNKLECAAEMIVKDRSFADKHE